MFYKGDQGITGTATAIVVKAGKKTMLEVPELKLKGTAANSTKGIYYELHPISAGDVTEIFVASPASGKGGSAVTLKNEDIYSMDCNLLSQ